MRAVSFLSKFYLPLVLLLVCAWAWRPLGGGDDFWAHAAIGRYSWENGVPTRTLWLWSADVPYIAHAYATGIWFFALLQLGGLKFGPGFALIFNCVMCALPFTLLWRFGRKLGAKSLWLAPLFAGAIWISAPRFQTRPELFTALFLTILYLILERLFSPQNRGDAESSEGRERSDSHLSPKTSAPLRLCVENKASLCLIPIFTIWPHFHGAVLFGLLVLWITVLADFAQFRRKAWPLFFIALVSTLALFAFSPYGFGYAKNWNATGSDTFKRIDEWKPFWGWPALAPYLWLGEIALWCAGTLVWALNPNRRWAQIGWMLLMGAAFLRARRGLWLTALTSVLVILSNWNGAAPTFQRFGRWLRDDFAWPRVASSTKLQRFKPSPNWFSLAAHASVLVLLGWSIFRAGLKWPPRALSNTFPTALNAELQKHAYRGRIWNDYEFSAAHEWLGGAKTPLWIDLNNAYPDQIMNDYFRLMESDTDPIKHLKLDQRRANWFKRNQIQVVALRPFGDKEGIAVVARWLDAQGDWKRVYRQKDGTIWIKKPTTALAKSR